MPLCGCFFVGAGGGVALENPGRSHHYIYFAANNRAHGRGLNGRRTQVAVGQPEVLSGLAHSCSVARPQEVSLNYSFILAWVCCNDCTL